MSSDNVSRILAGCEAEVRKSNPDLIHLYSHFYTKVTEEMRREALHKFSDIDSSVFKDDVAFKYANDKDVIKRLCGLK